MIRFEYTREGYRAALEFLHKCNLTDRLKQVGADEADEFYLIDFANDYCEDNRNILFGNNFIQQLLEIKEDVLKFVLVAGLVVLSALAILDYNGIL